MIKRVCGNCKEELTDADFGIIEFIDGKKEVCFHQCIYKGLKGFAKLIDEWCEREGIK